VDGEFMGLVQHITELDISLYADPGSCFENQTGCQADYGTNIPASVLTKQAELYRALFAGFLQRASVTSVSTWGVSDAESWLNDVPITRTNAPLLWDRDRVAKSALQAILDPNFTP
jgi:endo-1,4-beta-xylanase